MLPPWSAEGAPVLQQQYLGVLQQISEWEVSGAVSQKEAEQYRAKVNKLLERLEDLKVGACCPVPSSHCARQALESRRDSPMQWSSL